MQPKKPDSAIATEKNFSKLWLHCYATLGKFMKYLSQLFQNSSGSSRDNGRYLAT